MNPLELLTGIVAILIFIYLFWALLRPEDL